jgi:hypothetical protein
MPRRDKEFIRVLVGTPEGRRPLGSSRHRWENNIKMGQINEIG